jgi:hypothetical protein
MCNENNRSMTYTDPERTTPRPKVARSRFVLLDSLSTNPLTAEINWDDVIPNKDDTFFSGSLNAFKKLRYSLLQRYPFLPPPCKMDFQ